MAKKKQEPETQNTNAWITTYTDLMTLLLTFFVLLLSMSVRDNERSRKALNSLVGAFGFLPSGRSAIGNSKGTDVRESTAPMLPSQSVDFEMLKEIPLTNNLAPNIEFQESKKKLVIQINQKVLFLPGSTELTPDIKAYLATIASYLRRSPDEIEIRGHTDLYERINDPHWIQHSWRLSTERAQAVHNCFLENGIAFNRISAHGFSYFDPVVGDPDSANLRIKNQRVEIVIGKNDNIPAHLTYAQPKAAPFFNYKDFKFRLFPESEKNGQEKP